MAQTKYPEHVDVMEMATLRNRIEQLHSLKTVIASDYHDPSIEEVVVSMMDMNKLAHEIIESTDDILADIREAQDVNLRIG